MGLGLNKKTMRQKHKTYLFLKSQDDIVKYTFLSTAFLCVGPGETQYSMPKKIFFKSYRIFIWGGERFGLFFFFLRVLL